MIWVLWKMIKTECGCVGCILCAVIEYLALLYAFGMSSYFRGGRYVGAFVDGIE